MCRCILFQNLLDWRKIQRSCFRMSTSTKSRSISSFDYHIIVISWTPTRRSQSDVTASIDIAWTFYRSCLFCWLCSQCLWSEEHFFDSKYAHLREIFDRSMRKKGVCSNKHNKDHICVITTAQRWLAICKKKKYIIMMTWTADNAKTAWDVFSDYY